MSAAPRGDVPLVVGLGSNLGDRWAHLRWAQRRLQERFGVLEQASVYRTQPVSEIVQGEFLNTVVIAHVPLPASAAARQEQLLDWLARFKAWERQAGRRQGPRWGPRPLDIDLLLCGDLQLRVAGADGASAAESGIIVPHPRLRERRFVLAPLAELRPHWMLPGTRRTTAELLAGLGDEHGVQRWGALDDNLP